MKPILGFVEDPGAANMVVSVLGQNNEPKLINAGEQRFRGAELELRWAPESLKGFSASAGYSRHDSKFVEFTFVTPDGELRDVGGKYLELAPKQLLNAKLMYAPETGLGGFVALRRLILRGGDLKHFWRAGRAGMRCPLLRSLVAAAAV